jgi:hypothetical protein
LAQIREEHGLRVFENRVLRRIFGLKRDKERHYSYSSANIIRTIMSRRMRLTGYVA